MNENYLGYTDILMIGNITTVCEGMTQLNIRVDMGGIWGFSTWEESPEFTEAFINAKRN